MKWYHWILIGAALIAAWFIIKFINQPSQNPVTGTSIDVSGGSNSPAPATSDNSSFFDWLMRLPSTVVSTITGQPTGNIAPTGTYPTGGVGVPAPPAFAGHVGIPAVPFPARTVGAAGTGSLGTVTQHSSPMPVYLSSGRKTYTP